MRPTHPALRRATTMAALCTTTIGLLVGSTAAASAEPVTTWTAAAPITVGTYPSQLAADGHGSAYVSVNDDDGTQLKVIAADATEPLTIHTQTAYPADLAVDPTQQLIYATSYSSNTISVTTSGGVAQPALTVDGAGALGVMSLDAAHRTLYVSGRVGSNFGGPTVLYSVDLVTGSSSQVASLGSSMMGGPAALAVDPSTQLAYTSSFSGNSVVDLTTGTVTQAPSLGASIALDASRHALWTASSNGGVSLTDTRTDRLVVTVPFGGSPSAVAVDPGAGLVYVANSSYNSVSVIDEDTHRVLATVPVDVAPSSLAVDQSTGDVYVVNSGSTGSVSVITSSTENIDRSQQVSFTSTPPTKAYVQGTYTATATGGASGNRVHFSTDPRSYGICNVSLRGSVVFARTGTCIVDADQDGSGPWQDAPTATQTITVVLRPQTVTFPQPATLRVGQTQALRATSSAKLTVTYTVRTPTICKLGIGAVLARKAGTCRIDANAPGTAVYAKAATRSVSFTVKR